MYKLCKTEQSAKRQREIENCLFEIMKGKHYEEITITEICERMSMPRKAFYRYFDSKEDALSALIDHSMAEYGGFVVDKRLNRLVTVSCIDNLIKGAAGQAIQNMNLIYSLDESTGLKAPAWYL